VAIKLYNLSALPDEPMRTLLTRAKRLAGCRGDVIVKVTRGGHTCTGKASPCDWVSRWFLSSRRYAKPSGEQKKGHVSTDGGYVLMQPYHPPERALRHGGFSANYKDPLNWAQRFFETAIHEFAHVRDFQAGGSRVLPWSRKGDNGRRPAWGKRPEEIRAQNVTDGALDKIKRDRAKVDDLIIELAIQMEEAWVPKK
jgi:hypothetical protein